MCVLKFVESLVDTDIAANESPPNPIRESVILIGEISNILSINKQNKKHNNKECYREHSAFNIFKSYFFKGYIQVLKQSHFPLPSS